MVWPVRVTTICKVVWPVSNYSCMDCLLYGLLIVWAAYCMSCLLHVLLITGAAT